MKNINKPFIIGIAGVSGSGKTTISKKLAKKLNAKLIHLDDFWRYHNAKKLPPRKKWIKWEHPNATNFNKVIKKIAKLKNNGYIIVEGLHPFSNPKLRKLLDFKVYYPIPDNLVVKRRIEKFGYGDNQKEYSKEIVIKAYKKYGRPMKKYANLILNGNKVIGENLKKILKYIKK